MTTITNAQIAALCTEAAAAGDTAMVLVAEFAGGLTVREIAAGWRHLPALQSRTVSTRKIVAVEIRKAIGSLSRKTARAVCADVIATARV